MGTVLADGSVVPHYLDVHSTPAPEDPGARSNNLLRVGEVTDILYADDDQNRSKQVTEYTVQVQHYDPERQTTVTHIYPRCVLSTHFGSVADRVVHTLRHDKSASKDQDTGLGLGSKVLLACVNGEHVQPVILGAIADQNDDSSTSDKRRKLGHHYDWLFNGVNALVNQDGELAVTYNGKSNNDGSTDSSVSSKAPGTNVTFSKDGSWKVAAQKQSVQLDNTNSKLVVAGDQEVDLTCNGNVKVKSTGVQVGQATDAWMLGTTYRNAQSQLHTNLLADLGILLAQTAIAGANLTVATGLNAVPVVGGALAATNFAFASAAILQQVQGYQKMIQAITQFEANASTYLSQKNTTD